MASSSFFHETVYLKFDEVNIGKSTMQSDLIRQIKSVGSKF